ncbi:hypothetical protein J2Y69_003392 [Microbacterium resistens]|uniref:Uncharacterized protein n=1 Tax=Microbacterium resistens TaxID=156977 RepID=A0ABU1SGN6_9MICO|nr:hypothetical protein [Microbacterium resistens]MDR6868768.1 hypothetical protein [Microbacterium resistens]
MTAMTTENPAARRNDEFTRLENYTEEPLPSFSPLTADYPAERAAQLYPVDLHDGVDLNGSVREAYRRGYDDALSAASE